MLSQVLRGEAVSIKEPNTTYSGAVTVSNTAIGVVSLDALCDHRQSL